MSSFKNPWGPGGKNYEDWNTNPWVPRPENFPEKIPEPYTLPEGLPYIPKEQSPISPKFHYDALMNLSWEKYLTIEARRDFYHWFFMYSYQKGFETRWALAAWLVAKGAAQLAHMSNLEKSGLEDVTTLLFDSKTVSSGLKLSLEVGNMIIFTDVLPKLKDLITGPPVKGRAALSWDMKTLAEEQNLVQRMYDRFTNGTFETMNYVAKKGYGVALGAEMFSADQVLGDGYPYRTGQIIGFRGNLLSVSHRWVYGMTLARYFLPQDIDYVDLGSPDTAVTLQNSDLSFEITYSLTNVLKYPFYRLPETQGMSFLPLLPKPRIQYGDGSEFRELIEKFNKMPNGLRYDLSKRY